MSNTPHTLGEEFPGKLGAIHALKARDARFARLLKEYDDINDLVHMAESRIRPISQNAEADLRKRRLTLKDEIASTLAGNQGQDLFGNLPESS